jgi:hypothetical protein
VVESGRGGIGDLGGLTLLGIRNECLDLPNGPRMQARDARWDLKLLRVAVRGSPRNSASPELRRRIGAVPDLA